MVTSMNIGMIRVLDRFVNVIQSRQGAENEVYKVSDDIPCSFNVTFGAADLELIKNVFGFVEKGEINIYKDHCTYNIVGELRTSESLPTGSIQKLCRIKKRMLTQFEGGVKHSINCWGGTVTYNGGTKKLILCLDGVSIFFDIPYSQWRIKSLWGDRPSAKYAVYIDTFEYPDFGVLLRNVKTIFSEMDATLIQDMDLRNVLKPFFDKFNTCLELLSQCSLESNGWMSIWDRLYELKNLFSENARILSSLTVSITNPDDSDLIRLRIARIECIRYAFQYVADSILIAKRSKEIHTEITKDLWSVENYSDINKKKYVLFDTLSFFGDHMRNFNGDVASMQIDSGCIDKFNNIFLLLRNVRMC